MRSWACCRILSGVTLLLCAMVAGRAADGDKPAAASGDKGSPADISKPPEKPKPVAGKAEMLRFIPKKFGTLLEADIRNRQVRVHFEGEKEATTWSLTPDAELKIHGWWGRLDQFQPRDRIWAWFEVDRKKQPRRILMLADEISQLDISGFPPTIETIDGKPDNKDFNARAITLKPTKGDKKTLTVADTLELFKNGSWGRASQCASQGLALRDTLKAGDKVYVQTTMDQVRLIADAEGLEKLRQAQKLRLRNCWIKEGLPGTVTFLHPLSGEMELTLDHEAMRWARNLRHGDRVNIQAGDSIPTDVRDVRPWREKTVLRLVVGGFDQADFTLGQRVLARVTTPPPEVDNDALPPDIDRPRSRTDRIEWFLASTYCTCKVANNTCTGMFYTLASCNPNGCGMPNHIRELVGEMIDKGQTDRQIWENLSKSQGPLMTKPHLLP